MPAQNAEKEAKKNQPESVSNEWVPKRTPTFIGPRHEIQDTCTVVRAGLFGWSLVVLPAGVRGALVEIDLIAVRPK
jgi:hypothetical protein